MDVLLTAIVNVDDCEPTARVVFRELVQLRLTHPDNLQTVVVLQGRRSELDSLLSSMAVAVYEAGRGEDAA